MSADRAALAARLDAAANAFPILLTDGESEEANAQLRRLQAAGDPYALDKLIAHWSRRRVKAALLTLPDALAAALAAPAPEPHADGLLPCPFCGSQRIERQFNDDADWFVRCTGCGATTSTSEWQDSVVAAWNHRALSAAPRTPSDEEVAAHLQPGIFGHFGRVDIVEFVRAAERAASKVA